MDNQSLFRGATVEEALRKAVGRDEQQFRRCNELIIQYNFLRSQLTTVLSELRRLLEDMRDLQKSLRTDEALLAVSFLGGAIGVGVKVLRRLEKLSRTPANRVSTLQFEDALLVIPLLGGAIETVRIIDQKRKIQELDRRIDRVNQDKGRLVRQLRDIQGDLVRIGCINDPRRLR